MEKNKHFSLVRFDGTKWSTYSLKKLNKIYLEPYMTTIKQDENNCQTWEMDNFTLPVHVISKTLIKPHFYCKTMDKNFEKCITTIENTVLSSSYLYEMKVKISEKYPHDPNKYQNYSKITTFKNINFENNCCYIITSDMLEVIEILNSIVNEILK